jgi:NADH-quinone oxidoreductase subunit J
VNAALVQVVAEAAQDQTGEKFTFWICGTLAVVGAIGLIVSRKTVHSALFVALTMMNLAVLYVANAAPFLGLVQVIVYTGAVIMLFLFVLMIVGVDSSDSLIETLKGQRAAAVLLVLGFAILVIAAIGTAMSGVTSVGLVEADAAHGGNVEGLAHLMFTTYLLPLEVVASLLITAALGALVLAHRERWAPRRGQAEMSIERMDRYAATGQHPGPLPNPGVLATSNAIGTPALLPDGAPTDLSIPVPLRGERRSRLAVRPDEIEADRSEISQISADEEAMRSPDLAGVDGHTDLPEVYPEKATDRDGER